MEEELNYLNEKINDLEVKVSFLEDNKKNYTTELEKSFYKKKRYSLIKQKDILENILNCVTEYELRTN